MNRIILPRKNFAINNPFISCATAVIGHKQVAYGLKAFINKMRPMDTTSFFIEFIYNTEPVLIEVKPCCREDNVFYYDIAIKNQYQFTISPTYEDDAMTWKVSFKNADKQVDPALIDIIGNEIEKHLLQLN